MSRPERKWMKGQGPYRIKMPHSGREGEGRSMRSMSGPERKWMKGQGPYRIKMPHSGRRGRQINE